MNQETPLHIFKFELPVLKILEDSLKSRISLLQVRRIFLDVSDTNQLASIFKSLNSSTLKKVILRIDGKLDVDGMKFLENWKRSGVLILAFQIETASLEFLESINKLLYYYPSFRQIDIFYDNYEYDPCTFFEVPFEKLSENSIRIELFPKNLLAPYLVKLKLSNQMSLKVLENRLVMGKIVRYFKAFDIQNLRKTCTGIRSCVDYLKPEPLVEEYAIDMKSDKIITANVEIRSPFSYTECPFRKSISYKKTECTQNIVSEVLADFETILKDQKTCLEELRLYFLSYDSTNKPEEPVETLIPERLNPMTSEFLAGFEEILKKRSGLMKVKKLVLSNTRAEDVMQVLPYLDPKHLEKLEIDRRGYAIPDIPYDIEEMAKTEQWTNLKELKVKSELISTPIQKMNLTNCSEIFMRSVTRITSNDVIFLKENLLTPKLNLRFIIGFKDFVEDPQLNDFFGPPRNTFGTRRLWYFPIPGTNGKMLEIDLCERVSFRGVYSYSYNLFD
ncbi:hypothetical protein B9Z55_011512 [Caenorhabditis nigoni]|nr:hypothetical protein B9Z55_011512 [Caenorhabditis nigoni]